MFLVVFALICSIPLYIFEIKAKECSSKDPYQRINYVSGLVNSNADLIILGNSRAANSYNDSILSLLIGLKCLNLGWSGYPFDYQYNVMYKTYIKQNKSPHYVLLEVSPYAFFDYANPNYIIELLPYINRPEFKFYVELCPELSWVDKILFLKYAGKLNKVRKELVSFKPSEQKIEKIKKEKKMKCYSNDVGGQHSVECNTSIIRIFNTFIDECLENDIKVILICSPIHIKDGASYFDMEGFWKIIYQCIENKEIMVLNYQDFFGNDTIYFQDPVHLNYYGRDCYTEKVAHDLDSLKLIDKK